MVPDAIDLSAVRRALVVKLRHHGDVLLTSPVFSVLRRHAPGIEVDALVYADTRDMLGKQGFDVVAGTSAEFSAWIRAEQAKWSKVIRASGAVVD